MTHSLELFANKSGTILLTAGAVLMYIASRAGVQALAGKSGSGGFRGLAQWIPIAAVALAAQFLGRNDLAVSIIFCTSIAALSAVIGTVAITTPPETEIAFNRIWPLAVPATMLPLLAGLAARLEPSHAAIFIIEGIVIFLAWVGSDAKPGGNVPRHAIRWPVLVVSLIFAGVGAMLAIHGAAIVEQTEYALPAETLTAGILAPLIMAPILVDGVILAHDRRPGLAADSILAIVLLNLCCLLPIIILLQYLPGIGHGQLTPFPILTWRMNLILILLALMSVPVSLGRIRLGMAEGVLLIGLYIVYVIMVAASQIM